MAPDRPIDNENPAIAGPGSLDWRRALSSPELLADPVRIALAQWAERDAAAAAQVLVAPIDAALADTAQFCEAYGVSMEESVNCVVVAGRRGEDTTYVACLVQATRRADVNGVARRQMGARKASFAPMDDAVGLSGMEFGGITPLGLPGWAVLVDSDAAAVGGLVVIGSGRRGSKIALPAGLLSQLPGAVVLDLAIAVA
jgi:prolyl-tRNA editing enzyme YbaK/EbsC (Cys-tRNA(Pro) deacylase)